MDVDLDQDYLDVCKFFKQFECIERSGYLPDYCARDELLRLKIELMDARAVAKHEEFTSAVAAEQARFQEVRNTYAKELKFIQKELDRAFGDVTDGRYTYAKEVEDTLEFYTTNAEDKLASFDTAYRLMMTRCSALKAKWEADKAKNDANNLKIRVQYNTEAMAHAEMVFAQYEYMKKTGRFNDSVKNALALKKFEQEQPELYQKLRRVNDAFELFKNNKGPHPLSEKVRKVCRLCDDILPLNLFLMVDNSYNNEKYCYRCCQHRERKKYLRKIKDERRPKRIHDPGFHLREPRWSFPAEF